VTLPELFAPVFSSRAEVPALEFGGRTYTFADIDRRSRRVAAWLQRRGLRPGDSPGVYLENRVEFIDLFLACARTGVIFLPINILYRGREVSHIVADAQPSAIVASASVRSNRLLSTLPRSQLRRSRAKPGEVFRVIRAENYSPASPLAIVYTSGTTGTAKAPFSRTAILWRTREAWSRRGASHRPTGCCCRCRSFTCMDSATVSVAGWPLAV
jgi:acyl-CoA synthetase (AMP-forming)/AMP-acid ligase II